MRRGWLKWKHWQKIQGLVVYKMQTACLRKVMKSQSVFVFFFYKTTESSYCIWGILQTLQEFVNRTRNLTLVQCLTIQDINALCANVKLIQRKTWSSQPWPIYKLAFFYHIDQSYLTVIPNVYTYSTYILVLQNLSRFHWPCSSVRKSAREMPKYQKQMSMLRSVSFKHWVLVTATCRVHRGKIRATTQWGSMIGHCRFRFKVLALS